MGEGGGWKNEEKGEEREGGGRRRRGKEEEEEADRAEHNGAKTGKRYAHFPKNGPSNEKGKRSVRARAFAHVATGTLIAAKRKVRVLPLARFP